MRATSSLDLTEREEWMDNKRSYVHSCTDVSSRTMRLGLVASTHAQHIHTCMHTYIHTYIHMHVSSWVVAYVL